MFQIISFFNNSYSNSFPRSMVFDTQYHRHRVDREQSLGRKNCRQHIKKRNTRYPHNAKFPLVEIDVPDTRLKTHRLFQVDIDRREQCCAANYEQVVNHVVPSCYS